MNKIQGRALENPVLQNPSRWKPGMSGNLFGRPKKNASEADKITALRGAVAGLIRVGSHQFAEDLKSLKPKDRLNLLMQMLRLVLPKPRPTPLSEDDGEAAITTADILNAVYAREKASSLDEDEGDEHSAVADLLRSVRENTRLNTRDIDEYDDED